MSTNPIRLQHLFDRYVHNACSPDELKEFWLLMDQLSENDPVADDIRALWKERVPARYTAADIQWDKAYSRMMGKAGQAELDYHRLGRRSLRDWWRIAAAACVLGVAVLGGWYYLSRSQSTTASVTASAANAAPGATRASLTLADGSRIVLDSAHMGTIAMQGQATVQHSYGAVSYEGKTGEALMYNTLSTARGEQSPVLILADGSKVWLNAASSIRFPVSFSGAYREVEINGEAYFEVVHNSRQPFRVMAGGQYIEDVGTHFNINAYTDEADIRTTLTEGAVRIGKLLLSQGQQAAAGDGYVRLVKDPDIAQAMAWKNGLFDFNHANLYAVARQLERWYNISVQFDSPAPEIVFRGKMDRNVMLGDVLAYFTDLRIPWKMQGKTLILGGH